MSTNSCIFLLSFTLFIIYSEKQTAPRREKRREKIEKKRCTCGAIDFNKPSLVREICECAKHACRPRREGFCLPCVRGGGPRSGGRDLRVCEAHLQASPRGVRKPRSGWRDLRVCAAHLQASPRGVVKTIPQSACADSSLYTREPKNSAQTSRKPKFLLPF